MYHYLECRIDLQLRSGIDAVRAEADIPDKILREIRTGLLTYLNHNY